MKVGSYADVVFEVSEKKSLFFNNLKRSRNGRWGSHEIIGKKPVPEFMGPGQDEITMDVLLRAELGVNPKKELEKLEKIVTEGTAYYFLLGGKKISQNKWYLESFEESHEVVNNKGESLTVNVTLNLKEYTYPKRE